MDPDRYLGRIGLSPTDIDGTDFRALETLQRAHVRNVPFENLAITGDPFVTIATGSGHLKLEPDRLTVREGGREREEPIDPREWDEVLEREFGIPREAV